VLGRLGGEEFAVFMPACSPSQARSVAERIRRSVEENPVALDDGRLIKVTLSIGSTCCLAADVKLEDLLSIADQALYKAKALGRNRTAFEVG